MTRSQPTHLIFGTVIYMVSIFYHTTNQVGGLCVGGDLGVLPGKPYRALPKKATKKGRGVLQFITLFHTTYLAFFGAVMELCPYFHARVPPCRVYLI